MSQYKALLSDLEQLNAKIAAARQAEAGKALEQVRELVAEFGFTTDDVFGARRAVKRKTAVPQFRNPATGETWSGRGRAPQWMKGKDREAFRIKA